MDSRYFGWHRRNKGGAWVQVCSGQSEQDCWRTLLDILSEFGGGDATVLPAAKTPGRTAKTTPAATFRQGEFFQVDHAGKP